MGPTALKPQQKFRGLSRGRRAHPQLRIEVGGFFKKKNKNYKYIVEHQTTNKTTKVL